MCNCFEILKNQIIINNQYTELNVRVGLINDQKVLISTPKETLILEWFYCPICGKPINHKE